MRTLQRWTEDFFDTHRDKFAERQQSGHIRECHGDLHLGNIVYWNGELIPFDGIEFSKSFHWIDTLSDAAFTAMDFAAHGRLDYCHSFINATFETSGDYEAVNIVEWYLVYRTLVRAKVAAMRLMQAEYSSDLTSGAASHNRAQSGPDLDSLLALAHRFTEAQRGPPRLWITYGVSGSGKTMGSEQFIQGRGAVRVRADVERKRLAERLSVGETPMSELYSDAMTRATYDRLAALSEMILRSGHSIIVDATCLMRWQRNLFRALAARLSVPFGIVPFHADHAILRQRIESRRAHAHDASDADLHVLNSQLAKQEHLDADELLLATLSSDSPNR